MKPSVVVFGSVPLATWAASRMIDSGAFRINGIVCDPISRSFPQHSLDLGCAYDYARQNGIPVLTLPEVVSLSSEERLDWGVSVRFSRILKPPVINAFRHGILNLHGGELPRFRGVNIANHAILAGVKRGAGTLHFIDPGIDTGPIVDREFFPIDSEDTAHDVFLKTQEALMTVFERNLGQIASGDVTSIGQDELINDGEEVTTYYRKDLTPLRELHLNMSPDEIGRRVRAFDFPGHEPAYFCIGSKRFYVSSRQRS